MLGLIAILLTEAAMSYLYYDSCPWTIEKVKYNAFVETVASFMRTLANVLFIYVTFVTTVGYAVMRCDLSMLEIKVMFALTGLKFTISQLATFLSAFSSFRPFIVATMFLFDLMLVITTMGFMFENILKIKRCLSMMTDLTYQQLRNQVKFR
jgi:hypothetical protein